jgi:hypothetical protein
MQAQASGPRHSASELVFQAYAVVSLISTSGIDVLLLLTLLILAVISAISLWRRSTRSMPCTSLGACLRNFFPINVLFPMNADVVEPSGKTLRESGWLRRFALWKA